MKSSTIAITAIAMVAAGLFGGISGAKARSSSLKKSNGESKAKKKWEDSIAERILEIENANPSKFGLYMKDLQTGETYGHREEEWWYVASGVKLPVAITVFRAIENGKLSLETKLTLEEDDYVDGAGSTNSYPAGSSLSVRYLLEQMMIHSDNTASDLLIKKVSLEEVNRVVQELVPEGFGPITTLADVRRLAYSGFHPDAKRLSSGDFRKLKTLSTEKEKLGFLSNLLKKRSSEFYVKTLDEAFEKYYDTHTNSAKLSAYALLLEKVATGKALNSNSTSELLAIMKRTETGKERLKKHFPKSFVFAHKTGTQHSRICDFGLAWNSEAPTRGPLLIASCVRHVPNLNESESVLANIGKAIVDSKILEGGG